MIPNSLEQTARGQHALVHTKAGRRAVISALMGLAMANSRKVSTVNVMLNPLQWAPVLGSQQYNNAGYAFT